MNSVALDQKQYELTNAIANRQWAAQKAEQSFGTKEENRWAKELEKALQLERRAEEALNKELSK